MSKNKIDIIYNFVSYSSKLPEKSKKNSIFLDTGGCLKTGIIDRRQLSSYTGSTTGLIFNNPNLILDFQISKSLTIHMIKNPSFDTITSCWLISKLISHRSLPNECENLIQYSNNLVSGQIGATMDNPYSAYSAMLLLSDRLSSRKWNKLEDCWLHVLVQGMSIIEYIWSESCVKNTSILDIDAFDTPGLFGDRDREDILLDIKRYDKKIKNPICAARQVKLRLPCQFGGSKEVDSLMIRNVQNRDDPQRVIHFKDWARSDKVRTTNGFTALSVFILGRSNRCIISVKPDQAVSLKGLGDLLNKAEAQVNSRHKITPHVDTQKLSWYDGRSHSYSLIISPEYGTSLTADQIEDIILSYGKSSREETFDPESEALMSKEEKLNHYSKLVSAYRVNHATSNEKVPDIFISYAREDKAFVTEHIYKPLVAVFGRDKVFFDKHSLDSGVAWMSTLAKAIEKAKVFIPVYTEAFFQSDFCEWELQLALTQDPIGQFNKILPVSFNSPKVPSYCSLIQISDLSTGALITELVQEKTKLASV
jgi:hypothetical protein